MTSNNRIAQTSITATVPRQTPRTEFGAVMAQTLSEVVNAGAGLLSVVARGTPVLSAAVSQFASTASGIHTVGTSTGIHTVGTSSGGEVASAAAVSGKGEQWDLLEAQKLMNSQSQSFNLAYMRLQEDMQKESRQFNTITNIMKVRHDSAKAAINNIR